jgi:hypothetical protein
MDRVREFEIACKQRGFELVAVASGLAMVRSNDSVVILTLPRSNATSIDERIEPQVNSRAHRGRWQRHTFTDMKRLVKPDACMSWEAWDAKYEIRDGQLVYRSSNRRASVLDMSTASVRSPERQGNE